MILLPEQAASLHIACVILWSNGTVAVFDEMGEQMLALQGRFEEKAPLINACFNGEWYYGYWRYEHRSLWKACQQPRTRQEVVNSVIPWTVRYRSKGIIT